MAVGIAVGVGVGAGLGVGVSVGTGVGLGTRVAVGAGVFVGGTRVGVAVGTLSSPPHATIRNAKSPRIDQRASTFLGDFMSAPLLAGEICFTRFSAE